MTGQNLFEVVNGLRFFGIGARVKRRIYKFPDTYWILTRVELSKDQKHGKAFGRLVWKGVPKEKDARINSSKKHEWELVKLPNYKTFFAKSDHIASLIPVVHEPQKIQRDAST